MKLFGVTFEKYSCQFNLLVAESTHVRSTVNKLHNTIPQNVCILLDQKNRKLCLKTFSKKLPNLDKVFRYCSGTSWISFKFFKFCANFITYYCGSFFSCSHVKVVLPISRCPSHLIYFLLENRGT